MSAYIFIFFLSIYCFVVRLRQVDGLSCPDGRTDEPLAVEKIFCKLHCCWRSPEAAAVAVAYVSVRWRLWLGSTWEICAWGLSFLRFISETNDGVKGYIYVCVYLGRFPLLAILSQTDQYSTTSHTHTTCVYRIDCWRTTATASPLISHRVEKKKRVYIEFWDPIEYIRGMDERGEKTRVHFHARIILYSWLRVVAAVR